MSEPEPISREAKGKGRVDADISLAVDAGGLPSNPGSTAVPPDRQAFGSSVPGGTFPTNSTKKAPPSGGLRARLGGGLLNPKKTLIRKNDLPIVEPNSLPPVIDPTILSKSDDDATALISKRVPSIERKTTAEDFEALKEFLDLQSKGLSVAADVAKSIPVPLLPNLVGGCLKLLSDSLAVDKKMVENDEGWGNLLKKVDEHQEIFNNQMHLLGKAYEEPDANSPLLGPVKDYAVELETLMKDILQKSSGIIDGGPDQPSADQTKQWIHHYLHVEMTKENIDSYGKKLSSAMEKLLAKLAMHTSFEMTSTMKKVTDVAKAVDAIGNAEGLNEIWQIHEGIKTKHIRDKVDQVVYANIEQLLFPHSGVQPVASDEGDTTSSSPFGWQHKECHPGTRLSIMQGINKWAHDSGGPTVYVLKDAAGIGKSTIAYSLAQEWEQEKILASAFYFSRGTSGASNAHDLIGHLVLAFISHKHIFNDPDMSYKKISEARKLRMKAQWARLVYYPASLLAKEITGQPLLFVIDALDECSKSTRIELLELLLNLTQPGNSAGLRNVKVLLTTRPETKDDEMVNSYRHIYVDELQKHPLDHNDIGVYLKHKFEKMGLDEAKAESLSRYSQDFFILAETSCRILEESPERESSLKDILAGTSDKAMEKLDNLYGRILKIKTCDYDRAGKEACYKALRLILGATRSLSLPEAEELLTDKHGTVASIFKDFASVIGGGSNGEPIFIRHPTFREFMLDPKRSKIEEITIYSAHRLLASACIQLLVRDLQPDMCQIDPMESFDDTEAAIELAYRLNDSLSSALLYAASNWMFHAAECVTSEDILPQVCEFFETKLLNWIELGTLATRIPDFMDGIRQVLEAIRSMAEGSRQHHITATSQWCIDILAFLRTWQTSLQRFPLHVYSSAIAFAPKKNLVHQTYEIAVRDSLPKILLGEPVAIGTTLVLTGHKDQIKEMSYSNDCTLLVSLCNLNHIIVWDAQTGAMRWRRNIEVLHGKHGDCQGVAFLPETDIIVAVWVRNFSKVSQLLRFNCKSGDWARSPEEFTVPNGSRRIAWAPDLTKFVCVTRTGQVYQFMLQVELEPGILIKAQGEPLSDLSISRDGLLLAGISNKTLKIWSMTDQFTEPIMTWKLNFDDESPIFSFSPIDPFIFSFVREESLYIYNVNKGAMEFTLGRDGHDVGVMAYSPDGMHIAVRADPGTDITIFSGNPDNTPLRETLCTSHNYIVCLKFSPDNRRLVTGDKCGTIHIHDRTGPDGTSTVDGIDDEVNSLAWSHTGDWIAANSYGDHSGVWRSESEKGFQRYGNIFSFTKRLALSSSGIAAGVDGACDIIFFNLESGKEIGLGLSLDRARGYISAMAFSPDDAKLAVMIGRNYIFLVNIEMERALFAALPTKDSVDSTSSKNVLAYHPSGDYICYGESAWDLALDPITGDKLEEILGETFPFSVDWDKGSLSILVRPATQPPFHLPVGFNIGAVAIKGSLVALGGQDGHVVILDLTPLVREDCERYLEHFDSMRRERPSRPLRDILDSSKNREVPHRLRTQFQSLIITWEEITVLAAIAIFLIGIYPIPRPAGSLARRPWRSTPLAGALGPDHVRPADD